MSYDAVLAGYEKFTFTEDQRFPVYRRGSGPAVIVIHEMPGLHPLVVRFADRVAANGMTVFLPSLFGTPGKEPSCPYFMRSMAHVCVRGEFTIWRRGRSSPVVAWLSALARKAHAECGGKGVGAVGMCFTGGFALAMMTEPSVVAPVMSQPSLPFLAADHIDVSPPDLVAIGSRLEAEDLSVIGLRFKGDRLVKPQRFRTLQAAFGDRFEAIEIEDCHAAGGKAFPHSVLTTDLAQSGPTKEAERRVIDFLKART